MLRQIFARSDFSKTPEVRMSIAFGLAGLSSGVISAYVVTQLLDVIDRYHIHRGASFIFLLPGMIFFVTLAGAMFFFSAGRSLIGTIPLWRSLAAALLISLGTFLSMLAAILGGFVAAVLSSRPLTATGLAQPAYPSFFYALPVMTALVCGGCAAAVLFGLALYLFTNEWNGSAWSALVLASIASIVLTLGINPQILTMLGRSGEGESDIAIPAIATLLALSYTLYGACAGYWLGGKIKGRCAEITYPLRAGTK